MGWREWVSLPDLSLTVKAKIDTGARSSSLHAFGIEPVESEDGRPRVRFQVAPRQGDDATSVLCEAEQVDERSVKSSNGQVSVRPVVRTRLVLGPETLDIDLTLTSRADMTFRMLIGREALRQAVLVDASQSYLWLGKRFNP